VSERFEIVDAKLHHCGEIARRLRLEHRNLLLTLGVHAHRELRQWFDASCYRKAWMINGRLAAIGGVVGNLMSPDGVMWLALAEEALRFKVEMVKEARRQIANQLRTRRSLCASTLAGDPRSVRFAEMLGFKREANLVDDLGREFVVWEIKSPPAVAADLRKEAA
jgi:hypothetical protein